MSRICVPLLITALLLSGCAALPAIGRQNLSEQLDSWHKMIRWGEYEKACGTFAAADSQQQCRQWFPGQGFSVVEQTVQDVTMDDNGAGAIVIVAVDYVKPPSAALKRVIQRQRWEAKGRRWLLTGPPQEFP